MVNRQANTTERDEAGAGGELLRDLLGYLNFSQGAPSARFRVCLNQLFRSSELTDSPQTLRDYLLEQTHRLAGSGEAAFADPGQAVSVVGLVFDRVLPAYRIHHQDLLGHLGESDFFSPLLLAKMFESLLSERAETGSQDEKDLVPRVLRRLNHFVGYRPVAVLENGRRSEVYGHERFCPLPLYFSEVGEAVGQYEPLISAMIAFMRSLPEDLFAGTHFSLERLSELALDLRSHDHAHPVTKRTNYVFGEWDPDEIDTKGFYRRFVIRRLILDALMHWVRSGSHEIPEAERLYDAAAVLTGTILMASSISGAGPQTYDSSVSLTTLLPIVARQRDHFYQSLLNLAKGDRARRLKRLAEQTRQPFGHVRHELNMYLSKYGADQVQHRHLSWIFARMGYEDASREEASVIPCLSARFESEIHARLVMVPRLLRGGQADESRRLISEVMTLLQRGIQCGGIVDPWNILGFQGLFPLFFTREASIPDSRVDVLLEIVGQTFDACSLVMSEAAATGRMDLHDSVLRDFRELAEQWDSYATTTVNDLVHVEGVKSVDAAVQVARVLADWREAGESAGDISFWRNHVEDLNATNSFAQVVSALLERRDHVAAMGLLMQWLSRADTVPLESGPHSIHRLLHRLLTCVCEQSDSTLRWNSLRRLFAFMESNAGEFWEVPKLSEFVAQRKNNKRGGGNRERDDLDLEHLFDDEAAEENILGAAWDEVTYRDSTDDGNAADTMDGASAPGTTEFEVLYRHIEPRLKFLHTVGSLWGIAAVWVSRGTAGTAAGDNERENLRDWLSAIRGRLHGLGELVREVRDYEISVMASGLEGNIEYDIQMQCRFLLMQNALSTTVEFLMAERLIGAVIAEVPQGNQDTDSLDRQISGILTAVFASDPDEARRYFPGLCRELRRRPLLYVPFENGGQPAAILKARTLQSIIRVLLSQLPRLGLLVETYELLLTALQMERSNRPHGQAVTEFDRLFRIGLSSSVEAVVHTAVRMKAEGSQRVANVFKRIERIMEAYGDLWMRHSGSMRLSVVEDLHEEDFAQDVRDFIEAYGEELFHTRMLTLGNARAILHHGAESLFKELEETVALTQNVKLLDDMEAELIDSDDAAELAEFVYECVVDNFDRFLEYNTTTTYSDYGNRLYCLLDFLRIESLYDRFEWNSVPWQVAHEILVRRGELDVAQAVQEHIAQDTKEVGDSFVQELQELESTYGVRLPALHDHIHERIVGALTQNRMAALVSRACPAVSGAGSEEATANFYALRQEISSFMASRIGSGIEPPEWMQRLAGELDRVQEGRPGGLTESLMEGDFRKLTQKYLDEQISRIRKLGNSSGGGF
ncbi:MAG: hypothetical protein WCK86_01640 [Planctomycetia bacterium]